MAQQTIDIGASPNDGTGDPFRDAFDKCNDNFTELYGSLAGLLDFQGATDCSANPNYPAASQGDIYIVSVAGKIGGASGKDVEVGDFYLALADNAGGTEASVGTSWAVLQANLTGGVATDLDDLTDVNAPSPSDGDVLTWDSTPGEWVPLAPTGGSNALDDLTDVDAPTPSDGDVLTFDSGSGDWVPAAPTGAAELVFLGTTTVTAANADIALPSGYESFYVEFYLKPTTDNVTVTAQVTDDNFSTVKSGATDYRYQRMNAANTIVGASQSLGTTSFTITTVQGNDTDEYVMGHFEVLNSKKALSTMFSFFYTWITNAGGFGLSQFMGIYKPTTTLNGIRFSASSGNYNGQFSVWGRKGV